MKPHRSISFAVAVLLWAATPPTTQAQLLWTVGLDDNGWPCNAEPPNPAYCPGGGATATFVQENGELNLLPGNPASPKINRSGDNDYYFAGDYANTIASITAMYGPYTPVGVVTTNEESVERAYSGGGDIDLRYHFNLAASLQPTDLLSITFDANNLDDTADLATRRYGVEVYFNGVKVQEQIVIRPAQLGVPFKTPQFSLASVNAQVGPGYDNIVSLKGVYYGSDGGGNWMGFDYVQLNKETNVVVIPPAVFPLAVGLDDNAWPAGNGGGPNASFVLENGLANALPGSPTSPEIDQQADDDYYFAGIYTATIAGNGAYTPVGLVPVNEEATERGFIGGDNDLRFHFNLPYSLAPNQMVAVTFDALSLDSSAADPRYGVEVYVNGVRVQPEILIRPAQVGQAITTLPFTLGSVNAQLGPNFDNIITLRGINYSAQDGGNSMGIDYVQFNPSTNSIPPTIFPWSAGLDDDAWPVGNGGGTNASFVDSDGVINPLPGSPISEEFDFNWDDDYYFAGAYTTTIAGNGVYTPVGLVSVNEETAKGGFSGANNDLRYHFNLPRTLTSNDLLTVTFDALDLGAGTDVRYGVEVYFNNMLVQTQVVIRPAQLNVDYTTPPFTLASVNAQVGPGFDNIITLRGINYSAQGGSDSMTIDYIQLNPKARESFPWAVGKNDNTHITAGNGGGPNTTFVQENGTIQPLPGSPSSPEVDTQSDNDYYFAGEYSTALPGVISSYGAYTPLGLVVANEEGAERAFAGGDLDLRYHFNLPGSLQPDDLLAVTFDVLDLDYSSCCGNPVPTDPRYGVEVYFNGVLVQPQIVIRATNTGVAYTSPAFTLASVDARVGPGFDNIVSLKGINYNADGGGNWMGLDYVQLNPVRPSPFPWAVGSDDNTHITAGDGGGANTTFVQESGSLTALPGSPASREADRESDNDYYFSGNYTTTIAGNGTYTPVGLVPVNEEGAERAFCCSAAPGADNELRYHFNLPGTLQPSDLLAVTFDVSDLDTTDQARARYGVEVYFNGVLVQPETVIRPAQAGVANTTPAFSLASVNAQVGSGFDNIVTLKGINYGADGGGAWMGIDYVQLTTAPLQLLSPVVTNGQVTLNWVVPGELEKAPTILGPWTPITPVPTPPYSEAVVSGENRFFRLKKP